MKEHKTIEQLNTLVEQVLADDEESRNDDKRLTFKVMSQILTGDKRAVFLTLRMCDLRRLPAFSAIARCRAKIQNRDHKYLPTKVEVRKKRKINEQDWRTYFTGTPYFSQLC